MKNLPHKKRIEQLEYAWSKAIGEIQVLKAEKNEWRLAFYAAALISIVLTLKCII